MRSFFSLRRPNRDLEEAGAELSSLIERIAGLSDLPVGDTHRWREICDGAQAGLRDQIFRIAVISPRTGEGLDRWIEWLRKERATIR